MEFPPAVRHSCAVRVPQQNIVLGNNYMLRMCAITLGGLFVVFMMFSGELSASEKAELDALRAERTSIMAVLSEAFNPSPDRKGDYVPTLAEVRSQGLTPTAPLPKAQPTTVAPQTPVQLASFAQSDAQVVPEPTMALRTVTANRVNVRSGPSTDNAVVGSVVNAEIVRLVSEPTDGWVKIIVEGDGVEGFMASRFLAEM